MNNDELIQLLSAKLAQFRTPKDFTWLLEHLDKLVLDYERRYQKQQEYFKQNKQKLYQYNAQYRRNKKKKDVVS